jgi:hypothetical protein
MVAVEYFLILFAIIFFFKGKQIRRWTSTYGPLRKHKEVILSAAIARGEA